MTLIDRYSRRSRNWLARAFLPGIQARKAQARQIEHALHQNIAAISAEFHAHRLYHEFYDRHGATIGGFPGAYELCISMAHALTGWESARGMAQAYDNAGVTWIEVVEDFVDTVLHVATAPDATALPDPAKILPGIQVLSDLSRNMN
jgi:hypothetical protein